MLHNLHLCNENVKRGFTGYDYIDIRWQNVIP